MSTSRHVFAARARIRQQGGDVVTTLLPFLVLFSIGERYSGNGS